MIENKRKIVNLLGTVIFLKEYVGTLLINKTEININKIGTK